MKLSKKQGQLPHCVPPSAGSHCCCVAVVFYPMQRSRRPSCRVSFSFGQAKEKNNKFNLLSKSKRAFSEFVLDNNEVKA